MFMISLIYGDAKLLHDYVTILYTVMIFFNNLGIIQEVLHKTEGILLTPVAFLALVFVFCSWAVLVCPGLALFALVWLLVWLLVLRGCSVFLIL